MKKTPVPASIEIIGKTYRLELVSPAPLADDEHQDCGRCLDDEQRILVQKSLPPQTERDTVLHETVHALDRQLDLELTERQVAVLATGLFAVLRANPGLVSYLMER